MSVYGEIEYGNLLCSGVDVVTQPETILSGQNVVAGTVMGRITASEKLVIVNSANSDGSENPYCVMTEDIDASASDLPGITYHTGAFNTNKLVFGGTDTAATHKDAMRLLQLHIKSSVTTDGTTT